MHRVTVDWSIATTTDFEPSLKRFHRYLEDQGIRDNTITNYKGNVLRYLKFAKTDHPSMQDLERFRDFLAEKKLARSTKNQYNYSIRAYHAMLGETIEIKRLEPNNQIPYYFDKEDVIKIFSVIRNLKHLAMLQTIFYGCLRASELCNIDVPDIDFKNLTIRINNGKGGKDGISLISNECASTLHRYLEAKPKLIIEGREPLFFTDYGHRWKRTEVHRLFAHYKAKAGVEKAGGIHVFARHTTATLLIANGADIRIVQKVLRHNDIRTTLRYAHVSDKTKRECYEKCFTL
ncbi:MAG: tyrosine-type recombinase/integrase [Methanotrichaceae archaeon]